MNTAHAKLLASFAVLLLTACQSNAPRIEPEAAPRAAAAYQSAPLDQRPVYQVHAERSQTTIYVYRAGRAARFGHNHVLTVPQLQGWVAVPGDQLNASHFSLRFRLDQLQIDDAALRTATGGGFATLRSADDIAGTRTNMLKSLDADQYPWVVLNSMAVIGEWPVAVADVAISMHGVTRIQRVVLQLEHDAQRLGVRGRLALRQSDFGITPFSILGGALGIDDTLAIDFALQAVVVKP